MSQRHTRPRDMLAFHYGIVLPDDAGDRLDRGVARVAGQLPGLLLQISPGVPGFAAQRIQASKDG